MRRTDAAWRSLGRLWRRHSSIEPIRGQPHLGEVDPLPGVTRIDAALFFTMNEAVQFQVNIENALDETYFSDAHNNTPGAPINTRFTARVKF